MKQNAEVRKFEKVLEIVENNNSDKSKLIPILQQVQDEYRYLPEEVIVYIATALKMPVAEVYGVATFYAHFTLKAKGKFVVKICDGTACHVKGSTLLSDTVTKKLGLKNGEKTTADMLFTLETVSCLGACGLAPVMVVNDKVFGQVTEEKAERIIDEIMEQESVTC
ncbi:MAG: NAD(P)H-dependent oxidoreductase subunit E [Bacteroidota bacterium]|nr:NAD(P)H-dependent oxidoreductase subunit E [Bacteroidota bacterium]